MRQNHAQEEKEANEEKRKTFASSQGSAHVATKYMLDLDVLDEARTIMVPPTKVV